MEFCALTFELVQPQNLNHTERDKHNCQIVFRFVPKCVNPSKNRRRKFLRLQRFFLTYIEKKIKRRKITWYIQRFCSKFHPEKKCYLIQHFFTIFNFLILHSKRRKVVLTSLNKISEEMLRHLIIIAYFIVYFYAFFFIRGLMSIVFFSPFSQKFLFNDYHSVNLYFQAVFRIYKLRSLNNFTFNQMCSLV